MTKKHWVISGSTNTRYDTYEAAEVAAKRRIASDIGREEAMIYEAVAVASAPVPAVEVSKL